MLRVLDHRDVQMRVVVDARSGAITAVNRIVFQRPARCRSLRDRDYASRRPNYGLIGDGANRARLTIASSAVWLSRQLAP